MSISAMTVEDCKKIIRKRLGDYRYQHSVNVSKCAADLAEKYGAEDFSGCFAVVRELF